MKKRLAWVDSAKGLAILLVVLIHATEYSRAIGVDSPAWEAVNDFFSVLRMPLFFLLAGLFASSWTRRSWPELLREKVLLLMWVYGVWVVIRFALFSFVPNVVAPNESASLLRLAVQAVWSSTPTWFLYALAVFFIGAKLLDRAPRWLPMGAAGLVSFVFMSDLVTLPSSLWTGLAEYFVFFLAGAYYSHQMRQGMRHRVTRRMMVAFIPAWGLLTWAALHLGWIDVLGVRFALSAVAIPAGFGFGVLLSRSRAFQYMGVNTLPIYLGHTLVMAVFVVVLDRAGAIHEVWPTLLPPLLVVFSMLVSLGIYLAVRQLRVRGLYEPPAWVDGVAMRATRAQPSTLRR